MNMELQQLLELLRAAGAGVWLLDRAGAMVSYEDGSEEGAANARTQFVGLCEMEACAWDDDEDVRALDLRDAEQVLVVRLPQRLLNADQGLVTLVPAPGYCRVCGCSQDNPCQGEQGTCGWAESDLCTACVGRPAPKVHQVEQRQLIEPELPNE